MSRPTGHPTDVEPLELWEYVSIMPHFPAHWHLFYEILWQIGIRVSEALAIQPKDIDALGVWITRSKRKDHLREHLPLTTDIIERLRARITEHPRSLTIFPFTPQAAWLALQTAATKAGIRTTIHPHSFRHGMGHRAARAGESANTIQKILGHTSVATTFRYMKTTAGERDDALRRLNNIGKGT